MNPKEECNKSSIVFAFLFVLSGFVDVFAEMKAAEQPSFLSIFFQCRNFSLCIVPPVPDPHLTGE